MRIIAGACKGLPLKAVPGMTTRPTSDKVKEAIFSRIGPYFSGGAVLDLFAGTGGMGIEALSRGADHAVFIDQEKKSVHVIRDNIQRARMQDKAEIFRNEARRALKALAARKRSFDLVLLDPPYRLTVMEEIFAQLEQDKLLNDEAIVVVEHGASRHYDDQIGRLYCERRHKYGETAVSFYRYIQSKSKLEVSTIEQGKHDS